VPRRNLGLNRALGESSVASIAYGEVSSSIFFALGIVALYALGLTPWVLLAVGALFLLVALSYAEGTTMFPETGGGATFVRRAFNDPAGFVVGWVLFLDYLIVMALAALFVPHYLGHAVGWVGIRDRPWDVLIGVGVIAVVAGVRLFRRSELYRIAVLVAVVAFATQLVLALLGFAVLFSTAALTRDVNVGVAPTWSSLAFALPLAMLAFTGLETVSNLAAETREPGKTLPRSLFMGLGTAVLISVALGAVAISAYPPHPDPDAASGHSTDLGTVWLKAPLMGLVAALDGHIAGGIVDVLRVLTGASGVIILVSAITTSISGAGRVAYSLGQHAMLPHRFGVLNRRTLLPPVAIVSAASIAAGLLLLAWGIGKEVQFLASLYSFGVLIAFTAAQLAVIRLRMTQPDHPRPFRVPGNVRIRGAEVPVAALVGAPLTAAIWCAALATHGATRVAGPAWLAFGIAIFVSVRLGGGDSLTKRVTPAVPDLVPDAEGVYRRILVPLKLGPIGEEILGTAIRLAEEHSGTVTALHVIRVPLDRPLDAPLETEQARAEASLVEARALAAEHGVEVEGEIVRARSIGQAVVARSGDVDLIVMGSAPRWRRLSRFWSPTVDYVLRKAECEVMVIAYPEGVLEAVEDGEPEVPSPASTATLDA
jgi:APA family basic amino acid/polyamine antiporter